MDIEVLTIVIVLAASAGVLLTLAALGFMPGRKPAGGEPKAPEAPPPPPSRGRPGEGPAWGWFVPGGGRLGALRFARHEPAVKALAQDLAGCRDLKLKVGLRKKVLAELRRLPWPQSEAVFLARPADPFLLLIDRPLSLFDPRYDRYLIVPLGFMEAAGGLEAFLGAFAYEVLANQRDPMDSGEALLKDAAEAALAAGFAPPDVLRTVVQMLRQQVFAGRYRPFLAMPGGVPPPPRGPGLGLSPGPGAPAQGSAVGGDGAPVVPPPGAKAVPKDEDGSGSGAKTKASGAGPIPVDSPPLSAPIEPQAPPVVKGPRKPKK